MAKDWDGVATAIATRMEQLEMTQQELASRAGVALQTVRELQQNLQPRNRMPRTLAAISEGLRWPANHLWDVLTGTAEPMNPVGNDQTEAVLRSDIRRLEMQLQSLRDRLDAVEQKVS